MISCGSNKVYTEEDRLICCKIHATEWAQERANEELRPMVVWWVQRHDGYLVEPIGTRPKLRFVVTVTTLHPE